MARFHVARLTRPSPPLVSTRVEMLTRAARGEKHAANKQGATRPNQIEKHDVSHEEQR